MTRMWSRWVGCASVVFLCGVLHRCDSSCGAHAIAAVAVLPPSKKWSNRVAAGQHRCSLRSTFVLVIAFASSCYGLTSSLFCDPCCVRCLQAYGVAFASAIASGGDESDALAQATAIAFCKGGSTATAFAKAYSAALEIDKKGCLTLTKVKAFAFAQCKNGYVRTYAEASVEKKVLGFCGLFDQFTIVDFADFGRRRRV